MLFVTSGWLSVWKLALGQLFGTFAEFLSAWKLAVKNLGQLYFNFKLLHKLPNITLQFEVSTG